MGSVSSPAQFQVKKVAIIGAGPCGLSAARYLKAQAAFDSVVVFEQQDQVGGVWNYSHLPPAACPVPQEDPFWKPEPPICPDGAPAPVFPSPMYEELNTNLTRPLMDFSDHKFPETSPIFPTREAVQDHLVQYAGEVRSLIRFCSQVKQVSLRPVDGVDKWLVAVASTISDQVYEDTFDAIVVANGHYAVPRLPSLKGIEQFHQTHPSIITHSRQFRRPDPFEDKRVIVVGNGPSGLEIARKVSRVARKTYVSVRQASPPGPAKYPACEEIAEIDEFLTSERGVVLKDGTTVAEIDHVIFCTGFFYSWPFLHNAGCDELIIKGHGAHGLYKHIFYIKHPTLAFLGLTTMSTPWPLSEAEAAVISSVWSNNLALPPVNEMEKWSQELDKKSNGSKLHAQPPPTDGQFYNELHDWNLGSIILGKQTHRWGGEYFWQRQIFTQAKLRFDELGCNAITLEELGFHYQPEEELQSDLKKT